MNRQQTTYSWGGIILLAFLFLLLGGGLSSLCAASLPHADDRPATRVDCCHPGMPQQTLNEQTPDSCCSSLACHKPHAAVRDLGLPEFQQRLPQPHTLAQQTHSTSPLLRKGQEWQPLWLNHPLSSANAPQPEILSLRLKQVRSVVLRH